MAWRERHICSNQIRSLGGQRNFTRQSSRGGPPNAIAPSLRAPPFLGSSPTLHHWPGPAAEGRGGISGCSYLLEILSRRSACGLGGVIKIQEAMDGFPQVMLGIPAGPT